LLIFAAVCRPTPARASRVVAVSDDTDYVALGRAMGILEDPSKSLELEALTNGDASRRFSPSAEIAPTLGITRSAVWVRAQLVNASPNRQTMLLIYGLPLLERIDLYQSTDQITFEHRVNGMVVPVPQREYRHRLPVFPLTLEPHQPLTIYLRLETTALMQLDLALWRPAMFHRYDNVIQLAMGAALGILGVLFMYNILLYFVLHDRAYLIFVLFLIAFGLYQLCLSGLASSYVWPQQVQWGVYSTLFFLGLAIFFGLWFSREFLGAARYAPTTNRIMRVLMACGLVTAAWTFVDTHSANHVAAVAVVLTFGAVIAAAVRAWRLGYTPARYLLLAWALFMTGGVLFALTVFGRLPANNLTLTSVHLGFAGGGVLLSLALADRIQSLNVAYRRQARQTVEQRTRELNQTVQSLQQAVERHEQAELALQQSELKYRLLVESVNDLIYQTDAKGFFTYLNPTALQRLEDEPKNLLGTHFTEFVRPDQRKKVARFYDKQYRDRLVDTYLEFPAVTRRGREFWVGQTVHAVTEANEVVGFRAVARDITERKVIEGRLNHERSLFSTFMQNITDSIYFKDGASRFIKVNEAQAKWLGLSDPAEAIGKTDADFFTAEHARQARLDEELIMATGKPILGFDEKETWPDGRVTWVQTSKFPLYDADGRIVGTFGVSRDITVRRQMELEMRAAKEAAEEANRAKSRFLAGMSHELRTPLNAILGFSEVLTLPHVGELSDKQQEYVERIHASGRHLLDLINDILDLAKIESGKLELETSQVAVHAWLESSLTLVREKAALREITLALEVASDVRPLRIEADERKVKQIMFNLLSNATKFTPPGGRISVQATAADSHLRVAVRDTGIGIDREDQQVVFDEFVQLDSGRAPGQTGIGLGLSLTRRLVELHGGKIWVESDGPGKGSTFVFTLPFG
jgi:PAS domain S-box-containing protein